MGERRLIRIGDVCRKIGLGRTKVYALIKQGDFPAPIKMGRVSLWSTEKIDRWIEVHCESTHN